MARIISKTYRKLGLLTKGHTVEASVTELISRYVGGTAHDTNKKIDEAIGGVLFIDEAYQLTDHSDRLSYGQESLNLLLTRMENERERLAVIVAGYPDKMKKFLDSNPGLSRRIPAENVIHFPDYSPVELFQILSGMLTERHFTCSPEAEARLRQVIQRMYVKRDDKFGNGGEMRNLADGLIRLRASRVRQNGLPVDEPIRPEDIPAQYQISDPLPKVKPSPVATKRPIDKPIGPHKRATGLRPFDVMPSLNLDPVSTLNKKAAPPPDAPVIDLKPSPLPDQPVIEQKAAPPPDAQVIDEKTAPPPDAPPGDCASLHQEGKQLLQEGHYTDALQKLEAALACYRKAGDKSGEKATLNDIGSVYDKQGRFVEAVPSPQRSR